MQGNGYRLAAAFHGLSRTGFKFAMLVLVHDPAYGAFLPLGFLRHFTVLVRWAEASDRLRR